MVEGESASRHTSKIEKVLNSDASEENKLRQIEGLANEGLTKHRANNLQQGVDHS